MSKSGRRKKYNDVEADDCKTGDLWRGGKLRSCMIKEVDVHGEKK